MNVHGLIDFLGTATLIALVGTAFAIALWWREDVREREQRARDRAEFDRLVAERMQRERECYLSIAGMMQKWEEDRVGDEYGPAVDAFIADLQRKDAA